MTIDTLIIVGVVIQRIDHVDSIFRPGCMKIVAGTAGFPGVDEIELGMGCGVDMKVARSMTYLAGYNIVQPLLRQIHDLLMAICAGFLIDIFNELDFVFFEGGPPVMAEFAKGFRYQKTSNYQKKKRKAEKNEEDSL